jgi:hypothetical protein
VISANSIWAEKYEKGNDKKGGNRKERKKEERKREN